MHFLTTIKFVFQLIQSSVTSPAAMGDDSSKQRVVLGKSLYSFKTLTECPIIIALLFQVHRNFVNESLGELVPCVIRALTLQPQQQLEAKRKQLKKVPFFTASLQTLRIEPLTLN